MKSRFALWFALLLWLPLAARAALDAAGRNYAKEMSVNADVQDAFFQRYPDLAEERDAVAQAARSLAAQILPAQNEKEAAESLAARTRELLAQRSPQEWQRKAVSLYPELGVAGSEFNALFLRHYEELRRDSPAFTQEPSWPVLLAKRCADELQKTARARTALPSKPVAPSASAIDASAAKPETSAKRKAFWLSLLNALLLVAVVVQPARILFRCRRAFGGGQSPVTVWQQALGPAAWTYLVVALITLARTFLANADQGFIDRFGITLLVSLVMGTACALPVYAVALWAILWKNRRTKATV